MTPDGSHPDQAAGALLTVTDLAVRYGRAVAALRGVTLEVPDTGIVAVLGSNGAGKSTLLRAISGTLGIHRATVERGSIRLRDREVRHAGPGRMVTSGVVQVPEGRRIFGRLTVEENLRAGGIRQRDRGKKAASRDRVFDLFPILAERRRQRAGLLSGGEQQMLAVARGLMARPRLLLLDEPSLGLAPLLVRQIFDLIAALRQSGLTILLVEQNARQALAVAQHAYVLERGRVAVAGTAAELAADPRVQAAYLGG